MSLGLGKPANDRKITCHKMSECELSSGWNKENSAGHTLLLNDTQSTGHCFG